MRILYRTGRQAEALDVYLGIRDLLDRDLGIEPGMDLQRLQTAILRQDPGLDERTSSDAALTLAGGDLWLAIR